MVNRIVSLIPSGTEIVAALGYGDRLVGRSHECDYPLHVGTLPICTSPKFDKDASSIEIDRSVRGLVENALSVYKVHDDTLKQLNPDVIVTQSQCDICAVSRSDVEASVASVLDGQATIAAMEAVDLAGLWADILCVGNALEVDAQPLVDQLTDRLSRARRETGSEPPRVACLEWLDPLMSAGNWVPELIQMAGGVDLFSAPGSHSGVITWEAIVEADPDIIILMPCGYDLARTSEEIPLLTRLHEYGSLRAVKENEIYVTDGNHYFNRPGPRLVDSLEILVEILHADERGKFGMEGNAWERASRP
jgi:iron complex transport system substrate-binding protein